MRLVQLRHPQQGRRVALVDEPALRLIDGYDSVYRLAREAIREQKAVSELTTERTISTSLNYDEIYSGSSDWRLLPAMDHPDDPMRCFVAGTGLTHRASAANRDKMHQAEQSGLMNDSMRMYQLGVDYGRPEPGQIGVQPEWFWKGNGDILKAHGELLEVPDFADDGGEEPEVVGVYVVGDDGVVWRIGLTTGNEFADHAMEQKNYLYLAHSKIRDCAVGPELAVDPSFAALSGVVTIRRGDQTAWQSEIDTGEANMSHSLANLEHHHFKYAQHRRPGDAHLHFLGTSAFSFGAGVKLQDGDQMQIEWQGLGRPLRNPIRVSAHEQRPVEVKVLRS